MTGAILAAGVFGFIVGFLLCAGMVGHALFEKSKYIDELTGKITELQKRLQAAKYPPPPGLMMNPIAPRPMAACMKCGRLAVLQTASRCAECSEPEAA